MTDTIPIESKPLCGVEGTDVGNIFRGQTFSPCGRYALSTRYRGNNSNNTPSRRFYVVDVVDKKMHVYTRGDGLEYIFWVSFYFVNSCQLVFVCCHETGFKQQLVQICHDEKTLKVLGERSFPYTDPIAAFENKPYIAECSNYGQTINYEGKEFIVLMVLTKLVHHNKIILIPKHPCSKSKMKMFLVNTILPENHNNEVILRYKAKHEQCLVRGNTTIIINGCVCFPVTTFGPKVITGLYLSIDITKLENVYENEEVDKDKLYRKQEIAYSVISTPREDGDVETVWPANLANFYSNGNIIYQWKRQPNNAPKPEPGTVYKRASCSVFNGQVRVFDYETEDCQSPFQYTIHPLGLRLRWSNLTKTSVELKIENIERPIDSLLNLAKKKMLLENRTKDMKDPAIQKILWN